jgi:Ohr subfamily peroxiredoxin
MFAAGYAACFIGALKFVAGQEKVALPADIKVTGEVGIGPIPTGFAIAVKLTVDLGDVDADKNALVEKAHVVCPYSNATRGNVEVTFEVV